MTQTPLVSIIIPAFNSARLITRAVDAALTQSYKNIELIVVDDGSTDETASFLADNPSVMYLKQNNAGPAAARNLGASKARGAYLFFTDADCEPQSDWIEKAVVHFSDSKVAVVAGSYGISNPGNLLAQCIHKEIIFRHTELMPDYPRSFGSYNFGIRTEVFNEVGKFNEAYRYASGEDNDLSYKVIESGYLIYFERKALVNHTHPEKFLKYLIGQYRHGYWRVKMYKDHPRRATGDGYTFWKDIFEVLAVALIILSGLLSLISPLFQACLAMIVLIFASIELYFSLRIGVNGAQKRLLFRMMVLRAFYRTFGFIAGFTCLVLNLKKDK